MRNSSLLRKLYIIMLLSGSLSFAIGIYLIHFIFSPNSSVSQTVSSSPSPVLPSSTPLSSPSSAPSVYYDYLDNASLGRVVNKKYLLDPTFVPENLVTFSGSSSGEIMLQETAAHALENLFLSAASENIDLLLVSGYRSYAEQQNLQNFYIRTQGYERAEHIDCIPGASEHQLGLAVDLCTTDHVFELNTDFATTSAYSWLIQHCAEFGFILRYPENKEDITGIMFSPWNFRYVGVELATILMNNNLTLEEYYHISYE